MRDHKEKIQLRFLLETFRIIWVFLFFGKLRKIEKFLKIYKNIQRKKTQKQYVYLKIVLKDLQIISL